MTRSTLILDLPTPEAIPTAAGAEAFRAAWTKVFEDFLGHMQSAAIDAQYAYSADCSQRSLGRALRDTWAEEFEQPVDAVITELQDAEGGESYSRLMSREHGTLYRGGAL